MKNYTLPEKPRYSTPCNHCGQCCKAGLCPAAQAALPNADTMAPCPLLVESDGRALCSLVLAEKSAAIEPVITRALGIGCGCSMMDDDTTAEQVDRFNTQSFIKVYGYARPRA